MSNPTQINLFPDHNSIYFWKPKRSTLRKTKDVISSLNVNTIIDMRNIPNTNFGTSHSSEFEEYLTYKHINYHYVDRTLLTLEQKIQKNKINSNQLQSHLDNIFGISLSDNNKLVVLVLYSASSDHEINWVCRRIDNLDSYSCSIHDKSNSRKFNYLDNVVTHKSFDIN